MSVGRPKKASLYKPRQTWFCKFYNVDNIRCNKSLKTKDQSEAEYRRNQLDRLTKAKLHINDSSNKELDPVVYELYYGEKRPYTVPDKIHDYAKQAKEEGDCAFIAGLLEHNAYLEAEVTRLKHIEVEYESLKKATLAKIASAKVVSMDIAINDFDKYIRDKVTAHSAKGYLRYARKIQVMYPTKNVGDYNWDDIDDFIEVDAKLVQKGKSLNNRKVKVRALLSRFFSWAAKKYRIPNPVKDLEKYSKDQLDIIWYDVPQVERVLNSCDSYWAGILATMAYTGIGPKELSGITRSDFEEIHGEYFLFIEANQHRGTKRDNRKRSVNVDKQYLLPRILKFIDDNHAGDEILFALPSDYKITRDINITHHEKWVPDEIGRNANRDILAAHGMKVKNLRNTMGSLMLRSGYTVEEVAVVLGNSPEVVRAHYARLLSNEVKVQLKEVKKSEVIRAKKKPSDT
ncbi:hypothetical protein LNTAR_10131 [Lentisphaera araneosa HTCC2155]|uniref:Uncharacterized protein n=1 Tax=Lentisphaera araneosa HTCC2155 TaxID=313628 RepID=A6DIH9_9BACT|nr:site-specific integrase [Lentisphaera araneosa]EDM28265.1 hypothetical protein LNTAR_10131 [Lentisphaera araneosa HTCC2155]